MPRSLQVLNQASVCEDMTALRDPNVNTVAQISRVDRKRCPLFDQCNSGDLLGPTKRNCFPRMGMDVARYAAEAHRTIDAELEDFRRAPVFSRLGFIDPYADPDPDATVKGKDDIVTKVGEWAKTLVNGDPKFVRDERCICPVLKPTPGGCPVHGG